MGKGPSWEPLSAFCRLRSLGKVLEEGWFSVDTVGVRGLEADDHKLEREKSVYDAKIVRFL